MSCAAAESTTSSSSNCNRTYFINSTTLGIRPTFDSICQQPINSTTLGIRPTFDSICQQPLLLSVPKTKTKCLFKKYAMRVAKRPIAFCFSLLSPLEFNSPLYSSSVLGCRRTFTQSPSKRKGIRAEGANQLNTSFTMDSKCMDGKISELPISTCCHGTQNQYIWSSPEGGQTVEIGKQIFCSRPLNMKNIVAVGFDMDYTLAQYKPETFESLTYEGTIKKLVYDLGYPQELLEWSFDWTYMVRGLVLDKKRGNILKMDRHKYVKVAYHGFKEMSKEDKVATYGSTLIRDAFDEPDYALIDTLFSLAEAFLFAQLIDFKDNHPGLVPEGADYSRLYKDVRAAVDLCHRDGTLKEMVAKDPKRYINEDFSIVPMLKMVRDSGRATFLVTNSLWDYTNVVMNFLCDPKPLGGSRSSNFDWLQYFDVVITGSAKPGFFLENRTNLFEVEPESGMLLNTDNGTPMAQEGSTSIKLPLKSLKKSWKVFQGGNVGHLHKLLSIESSSQVGEQCLLFQSLRGRLNFYGNFEVPASVRHMLGTSGMQRT